MSFLEDSKTFINSLNRSIHSFNVLQHFAPLSTDGINNMVNEVPFINKNNMFKMYSNGFYDVYDNWKDKNILECYSKDPSNIETSLNILQHSHCRNNNQTSCIVPPNYSVGPLNESNINSNALHTLVENNTKDSQCNGSNLSILFENKDKDNHIPQDIQELIYALQSGGSRCKMEAAIAIRSLATSHYVLQLALIEAGGIGPLVNLLKYKAEEAHWPTELREKATITVRAEAALALASLSVSNDDIKDVIGAAGAIPLLCELIHFDENNSNPIITSNYNSQEMAPFLILARDASAGALSCLSKSEKNKEAIINTRIIPTLIRMIDEGTNFGRAAAANVISKLASGEHANNYRVMLGREVGTIASLVRLLKYGSSKAKETAAEALENLAYNDCNKTKIEEEGGVECLMQLLENGTCAEYKAAATALKILKASTSSERIQQLRTDEHKYIGGYDVEELNQPKKSTIGHVENKENERVYKFTGCENKKFKYEKDVGGNVASTTVMDDLQHLNNDTHRNFQISNDSHSWQKEFRTKYLDFYGMQNISTSELTSTLAPPLLGQPSMQVDAILENIKKSGESNVQSNKRIKMTIPHIEDNQNTNIPHKGNNPLIESKFESLNQSIIDSMQIKYSNTNMKNLDQALWNKNREFFQQRNQCFQHIEGFGLADTIRDQQKKQCLIVDNQLVASGIVALVNALSSPNPSAQEFSALALMLLASQGGFEVKTAISDAGAIPLLITMVDSSIYPMIRESAAGAIAKLVSCHPVNRARVLKAGGIKSMVNMAQWSTTLLEDPSSVENVRARVQAAAIVAVLNVGNVQDKQNFGMGLRDALPILIHLLESDDFNELEASVGGLQALSITLKSMIQPLEVKNLASRDQRSIQITSTGTISIEMIVVLLYLIKSNSRHAKAAALEVLTGFRQNLNGNRLKSYELQRGLYQQDITKSSQLQEYIQRDGLLALSTMLEQCPTTARESVTAAFASAMASEKLSVYVVDEGVIIKRLMVILEEGPTIATKVSAAASIATIGARKKRLDALSKDHILLLLQVLTANDYKIGDWKGPQNNASNTIENLSMVSLLPHLLLREHITAIIVYIALSGDSKKKLLIDVGTTSILVAVLRECLSNIQSCNIQNMKSTSKNKGEINGVPPYLHATQEFATIGIIMLADKNQETIEKIVETGGISLLVKMLTATMGCKGKLGANWSEMAAAALLTLAESNNARDEIVRVGGIAALVQVLNGEGGAIGFSLTGLATLAQLLGVLGLTNEENKVKMADEGAIKCLVDILVGNPKYYNSSPIGDNEKKIGFIALTQEAAAAALATIILHCRTNAKAAAQVGAIEHLVKLLGPPISKCDRIHNLETSELLPSTYKSIRSEISLTRNRATISNGNYKVNDLECRDSKINSIICDKDSIEEGLRIGGPLAAMAALGNMVSSYPQCWREIVNVGAAPRLANLLQGRIWMHSTEVDNEPIQPQEYNAYSSKLQESAILIFDLLIDCEEKNC